MKILRYVLPLLLLPLLFTACSDDDDPVLITTDMSQAPLHYNAEGTWTEVASNNTFSLQYLQFSHAGEIGPWGLTWRGFTPARYADLDYSTVSNWLDAQFQIPSKGGVRGLGTPYIVAFWNTQENDETPTDERSCRITYQESITSPKLPFTPKEMYVQLTCYSLDIIEHGNAFSRAFAAGDKFTLTAVGVHTDGTTASVDFNLADYSGSTPFLADEWTRMDLSSLGQVYELYFTMSSSDTGAFGMNTPSYFALDRLSVSAILPN